MIDVKETLNSAAERMEMAAMYLAEELSHVRAGRANVAILDGVRVNSYGSMVPLNQVATVTTPDARTIAIRPWDKKAIKDIEKAIMDSGVGITPENNGEIVRLGIPQPTGERRKELVKQCNKIAERAKIEVRNVRQEIKEKLKKAIEENVGIDYGRAKTYTVGSWLEVWMENYAKIKLRPSTFKTSQGFLKNTSSRRSAASRWQTSLLWTYSGSTNIYWTAGG